MRLSLILQSPTLPSEFHASKWFLIYLGSLIWHRKDACIVEATSRLCLSLQSPRLKVRSVALRHQTIWQAKVPASKNLKF